jgi:hypothetical protein
MTDKVIPFPEPPPTAEEKAFDQLIADFQQLTHERRLEVLMASCDPEEIVRIVAYLTGFLEHYGTGNNRQ